jgi:rubrerythrin
MGQMSIVESLKKLVDPIAARDKQAELISARTQPVREDPGGPQGYECRVCGYLSTDPSYCPTCLALTMRPSTRPAPAREPASEIDGG